MKAVLIKLLLAVTVPLWFFPFVLWTLADAVYEDFIK